MFFKVSVFHCHNFLLVHFCFSVSSWSKVDKQLKFTANAEYAGKIIRVRTNLWYTSSLSWDHLKPVSTFGYQLNMSYFESQSEGVMDPKSRYSVVGVKIGDFPLANMADFIFHFVLEMTSIYLKFLLLYYLPSYMITISSWFFYLLPSTSYPARTALLMTAFLLLIQIYNSVVNDTPNSNGNPQLSVNHYFVCNAAPHP